MACNYCGDKSFKWLTPEYMMLHAFTKKEDAFRDAEIHSFDRVVYFATPRIISRDREIIRSYDMEEVARQNDW